jgi:hypothetical protein
VNEGYKQYLPLINHALSENAIVGFPPALIAPVKTWLQTNAAPDYPIDVP